MIGLVDGDILVFRCGFAAERNVWHVSWGEDFKETRVFDYKREAEDFLDTVVPGKMSREEGKDYLLFPEVQLEPLSHALHNVKKVMEGIMEECQLNPFDVKVALSSGRCFRHDLAKTRPYKGNRDTARRPKYENEIRDYLKANYDTTIAENEEADDLLGIWQTKYGPENSIIISIDKDLDQIPGLKYNWVKDVGYNITEEQGYYNFHIQLMSGDSTDNIPGLPGIGPGKAAKALHGVETESEQFAEVQTMYSIHSGKEDWWEYLVEQGRLVFIRREPDQMWEPPPAPEAFEPVTELTMELD